MINSTYILVLSDASYAKRQLRPIFWGDAWQRLSQSFSRCWAAE